MTALLRTSGIGRTFSLSGDTDVVALQDVDLTIQPGEFTVLMGSSGSGKSTLLYLLSGLERATEGQIHFQGRQIEDLDETQLAKLRRRGFGFVFQAIHLIPHLTLFENVAIPGYLVDADRAAVRARTNDLLERFGIGHLASRLPAQTSGGEQQRAAIARALINQPQLLLADEPTGALNSAASQAVLETLARVHAEGGTILMATHEVRSACYGSRVLYMRDGQVCSEYSPGDPAAPLESREKEILAWLTDLGW